MPVECAGGQTPLGGFKTAGSRLNRSVQVCARQPYRPHWMFKAFRVSIDRVTGLLELGFREQMRSSQNP
eukprot:4715552-Alexandrium_andersonii.AAC.1